MTDTPPLLESTRRALVHRLARAQAEGRAPSLVAGMVRDGQLVWWAGRGRVDGERPDADTQYRIGSITKTFVGGPRAAAARRGPARPDRPAGDATCPAPPSVDRDGRAAAVPHRRPARRRRRRPGGSAPTAAIRPAGRRDARRPRRCASRAGRRFHYSNPGFALLGALVGAAARPVRGRRRCATEVLRAARDDAHDAAAAGAARRRAAPCTRGRTWCCPSRTHDAGLMAPGRAALVDRRRPGALRGVPARRRRPGAERAPPWRRCASRSAAARRGRRRLRPRLCSSPRGLARWWATAGRCPASWPALDARSRTGSASWPCQRHRRAGSACSPRTWSTWSRRPSRVPEPWAPAPGRRPGAAGADRSLVLGRDPVRPRCSADRHLELVPLGSARARSPASGPRPTAPGPGWTATTAARRSPSSADATATVSHLDLGTFVLTREPYAPAAVVPGGVDPAGLERRAPAPADPAFMGPYRRFPTLVDRCRARRVPSCERASEVRVSVVGGS